MTEDQIISELLPDDEEILYHDFPDVGEFFAPRKFGWKLIGHHTFGSIIFGIPVLLAINIFFSGEFFPLIYLWIASLLTGIFMDWRDEKNLGRSENYRNVIITDKRIIQINRALNTNGSLRVRFVDPSNFISVEDKFSEGSWWAAAATRDADKSVLITSRKTEAVKELIHSQFLSLTPKNS